MGFMASDCVYFQGITEQAKQPRTQRRPHFRRGARPEDVQADTFFCFLFAEAGLDLSAYRGKALNRRIPACLRFLRVKDLEEARAKLYEKPQLVSQTLTVALLGVTDFCRDAYVFTQLWELVIPSLGKWGAPLRVWSAACSDGREMYSVAILLKQAGLLDSASLLGTDCRADAILQARQGQYPAEAVSNLHPSWLEHFSHSRKLVSVDPRIRGKICWIEADLLQRVEPGPWDLILWRNMSIYLQTDVSAKIWARLVAELAPGGYIISGRADYAPPELDLQKVAPCIYQKRCPILQL